MRAACRCCVDRHTAILALPARRWRGRSRFLEEFCEAPYDKSDDEEIYEDAGEIADSELQGTEVKSRFLPTGLLPSKLEYIQAQGYDVPSVMHDAARARGARS